MKNLANHNDVYAGARTAWSSTVVIGDHYLASARYWYNGLYNANEDAAEVMLNALIGSNGKQQSPTSPQPTVPSYIPSDFSNYTKAGDSLGGGGSRIGGNGGYSYGSIGDTTVGQGLGGGQRHHTHSHLLAHGSPARGAASFAGNYGG